jgi:ElaB/YqjD/DUF883 family membrane-anchored ribosome-binding protein
MNTETIPNREMAVGVETLRDDVQQLTDDFQELLLSIGEHGKSRLAKNKERIGSFISAFRESARGKFSDIYQRVGENGRQVVEKSRKNIEARPLTTLFVALGAGLIIGAVLKRS